MTDQTENPMGLDGFAFVEFTSPDPDAMVAWFEKLGFTHVGTHKSKNVRHYAQGEINFLLNMDAVGQVADFRKVHGASANAMGFNVADDQAALTLAIERGAVAVNGQNGPGELDIPAIEGIGGANLYLVEKGNDIWSTDFEPTGAGRNDHSVGLDILDHLTHNLKRGRMDYWADYYERIFNFRQIRYFDIEGQATGLFSKAMTAPDDKIRIPLNESQDEHSQIEEFIKDYKGEGIQHIALTTDDIFATVDKLRANGIIFQDSPDTYFDMIDKRLPGHGHDVAEMRKRRILIDGAPETGGGLLLQIFTANMVGPIFFEIIQRKGNDGFGEGNFKALFESIELDQIRRGVVPGVTEKGVSDAVAAWLDASDPATRGLIERLRALALAAAPDVTEQIKWNAPSFCVDGDDRITLGLERKGGVRAVLHRGAKAKDTAGFGFADPDRLATWPSVDRGVLTFADEAALEAKEEAVAELFRRWLEATR